MYVGLTEERSFTAREVRRLESLGYQLTIHLDTATLYSELRERIDELDSERQLRERFVSILAHDLRGPLSAAQMSAQSLAAHPEGLDERRDLASRVARNIDRTDRMIRDLLDANRIRAGGRLPLRIDECDLGVVTREVFEELVATFGERFVLTVEDGVRGFWSGEELRRAIWNLAANAIKYGSDQKPITLSVKRVKDGARVAVHNHGPAISADDQKLLFRPFSRTHTAQAGSQKGWGLGLTLVHGCAEAHGGQVQVESLEGAGTTFALELPLDARPFQPRPDEPLLRSQPPLPMAH
jgi:signal transduction histidine kinase